MNLNVRNLDYSVAVFGQVDNLSDVKDKLYPAREHHPGAKKSIVGETLSLACSAWGIDRTLDFLRGPFVLVIRDRLRGTVTLARDRFGEQPFYYGFVDGELACGTHPADLFVDSQHTPELDMDVLPAFLEFGQVPVGECLLSRVHKLPPGGLVEYSAFDLSQGRHPEPRLWWSVSLDVESARAKAPYGELASAVYRCTDRVALSIDAYLRGTGPCGVLLDDGVPSSLIAAYMQRDSLLPVPSFSLELESGSRSTRPGLGRVTANHLGTRHTTFSFSDTAVCDWIAGGLADDGIMAPEPCGRQELLPARLLRQYAACEVPRLLASEGAASLFGGRPDHVRLPRIWQRVSGMSLSARRLISQTLALWPSRGPAGLAASSFREFCEARRAVNPAIRPFLSPDIDSLPRSQLPRGLSELTDQEWLLLSDLIGNLPGELDSLSVMKTEQSAPLVRYPFLDPRILYLAWRIPVSVRMRDGEPAWPLKEALFWEVPRAAVEGCGEAARVDIGRLLLGPLRDWAEELLSPGSLADVPALEPGAVRRLWKNHLRRNGNYSQALWPMLQLIAWQRNLKQLQRARFSAGCLTIGDEVRMYE